MAEEPRLPPGHPPWESFNGIRVGGLTGALLGAMVAVVTNTAVFLWIVVAGAAVGAVVGYLVAAREMHQ